MEKSVIYISKDSRNNNRVEYLGDGAAPHLFKGKALNDFSMHMKKGFIGEHWVRDEFTIEKNL
jgi:hypothetical protein